MSVNNLVYGSVQDCKSGLHHYTVKDIDLIRAALELSRKLGHTTRAKLLESKLKRLNYIAMAMDFHKGHGCKGAEKFETCTDIMCVRARSMPQESNYVA